MNDTTELFPDRQHIEVGPFADRDIALLFANSAKTEIKARVSPLQVRAGANVPMVDPTIGLGYSLFSNRKNLTEATEFLAANGEDDNLATMKDLRLPNQKNLPFASEPVFELVEDDALAYKIDFSLPDTIEPLVALRAIETALDQILGRYLEGSPTVLVVPTPAIEPPSPSRTLHN